MKVPLLLGYLGVAHSFGRFSLEQWHISTLQRLLVSRSYGVLTKKPR